MTTTIQKWGNSMALRLPKAAAEAAHVGQGTKVHIHVIKGKIIIVPEGKPRYTLRELAGKITARNRQAEVDWGSPQGKEEW